MVLNDTGALPVDPGPTNSTVGPPRLRSWGLFDPSSVAVVAVIAAYGLVCLVGLFGNSMVIYVILRYTKMKTATNIYILNLAVADELFMMSVPFLATSTALQHWPFGSSLCRLVLSVDGINMFTSVFCLTVLTFDRYVAVVHPIKAARYRRPSVAKAINAAVWALSMVVILPIVVYADTRVNADGSVVCNLLWPRPEWSAAFVVYTFTVGFLLPVAAICLCYALIVAKMRSVALRAGWQQRKRSERKVTLMVTMVVAVFVACWMPFYVVQLVNVFEGQQGATVNQLAVILGYANSCANPILYGFLSDSFRHSFQRVLCVRWAERYGAEDPGDYYATAVRSRALGSAATAVAVAVAVGNQQQQQLAQGSEACEGPCAHNGTCVSRTTLL
ncbi:somatostatin receptor type 1-like [Lampetra fluviatilis]